MNSSPTFSTPSPPRFVNSENTDMDWGGWALFGLVATAVLTAVMIAAQLAGLTRLDLPLLLGTVLTEDPDRARVAGFFVHLTIGQVFALGYAAAFALLDRATWWLGGLFGLLQVLNRPDCSDSTTVRKLHLWPSSPTSPTESHLACCSLRTEMYQPSPSSGEADSAKPAVTRARERP